jgi:D-3-phosphoglycerate dehydrogenase
VINAGKKLKVVSLATVGVDSVDVDAATALGIPVTNCPDTFIEEVADHVMTLILASWRRLVVQDQMVRKGDWAKARPMLYQFPRLMGRRWASSPSATSRAPLPGVPRRSASRCWPTIPTSRSW